MQKAFKIAFPRTLPVMVGYLVLGIAFGLLLSSAGFGLPWAALMSLIIFAGSAQFLGVSLLSAGAALPQVALLTWLLNFRHFFYGLTMIDRYRGTGPRKAYLIFGTSDETYALLSSSEPPTEVAAKDYYLAVTLLDQTYWFIGSLLGCTVGELLTFDTTGVDFAMTALFVVLAVEQWKDKNKHFSALCGLCCGVIALVCLGADMFLIPALVAIAIILLVMRSRLEQKEVQ